MSAIELINITKSSASNQAVDDISFEVQPGERFALLNPNGAGKTTTIRMILATFQQSYDQLFF